MTKRSDARKREWANPTIRKRRSDGISHGNKKRYEDPAERQKQSERRKRALLRPDIREANRKHLENARKKRKPTHGLSKTAEYTIWDAMIQRCTNPNNVSYQNYGGRGIRVHDEWIGPGGFLKFFACLGRRSPRYTLGRIDNDGNYEPGNVRWETRMQQMRNWRRNRMVTIDGLTLHLAEWARRIGVTDSALSYRIKQGWPDKDLKRPGRKP